MSSSNDINGQTVSNSSLSDGNKKHTNEKDKIDTTEIIMPDLFVGILAPQARVCRWLYTPLRDDVQKWAKRYLVTP